MKKISVNLYFVFFLMIFSNLFAASANKEILIAPAGMKLIDEEIKKYPDFDELKAVNDAEKKFPLLEIGTKITVNYKRNVAEGKFYGVEGRFAKVGTSRIPLMDLSFNMLCKLSKEKNSEERKKYVARMKSLYIMDRKDFLAKITSEIGSKYPLLEKSRVEDLFMNIDNKVKVEAYIKELMTMFENQLPLKKSLDETKKENLKLFLSKHSELLYKDGEILDKAKVEAAKKAAEEKEKKRLARIEARKLLPTPSTE